MNKLREYRERMGLNRQELSRRTGISAITLRSYELGTRDINGASARTIAKLAIALYCDPEDLLDLERIEFEL